MLSRRLLLAQILWLLVGCAEKNTENKGNSKILKSNSSLQTINIPPVAGGKPTGVIVALHGWGSNAEDLAALAPALNLPTYQVICPQGIFPHPRVPGGRMWYDLDGPERHGLAEGQQAIREYMTALPQTTGVDLKRTILLGFSQGGAMTLDIGLNLPLAGLISLSGYLHPIDKAPSNPMPPILIVHGRQDQAVPLIVAQNARDTLLQLGAKVQYEEYEMGHEIIPPVIKRVQQFITEISKAQ